MSKPVLEIEVMTSDDVTGKVMAVVDSGSFYTIIREDCVPSAAAVMKRKTVRTFRAASTGSKLTATGDVALVMTVEGRQIDDIALVSPDLAQEMLLGAGTMQKWDISILNANGHTKVTVGRDMRDPHIVEVD